LILPKSTSPGTCLSNLGREKVLGYAGPFFGHFLGVKIGHFLVIFSRFWVIFRDFGQKLAEFVNFGESPRSGLFDFAKVEFPREVYVKKGGQICREF
jgi:hypothetical protein